MNDIPVQENPAQTLARSAFGFAVVALIPVVITWLMVLFAPPSPYQTFQQIRIAILIGLGLLLLLLLWVNITLYRTSPETLQPLSEQIAAFLSHPLVVILAIIILLQSNLLALRMLHNIAPSMTNPARFLLFCWSILASGILFLVNRAAVQRWLSRTATIWLSIGLAVGAVVIIAGLLVVNNWMVVQTGIDDRLRGGLDYRELHFFDDDQPAPAPPEFWQEQARTRVRWSPYTYWVMDEFQGRFINVDASGLRYTPQYGPPGSPRLYVFGGSTVWGEGARDAYTIPGHLARLFSEQNMPQTVMNYGQSGYVSTQDLIWFQLQLAAGNIPERAVFYQGFNDILSAWGAELTGVTLQEEMRLNDSEAGRILRAGQPALLLPGLQLENLDLTRAAVTASSPEAIVSRWLANKNMVETLAAAYGVDVLFIWQPSIIYKDPLTASEQAVYDRWNAERPGLFDLYQEVDLLLRNSADQHPNLVILSDLFAGSEASIFHDLVHITEDGNFIVAQALAAALDQQN